MGGSNPAACWAYFSLSQCSLSINMRYRTTILPFKCFLSSLRFKAAGLINRLMKWCTSELKRRRFFIDHPKSALISMFRLRDGTARIFHSIEIAFSTKLVLPSYATTENQTHIRKDLHLLKGPSFRTLYKLSSRALEDKHTSPANFNALFMDTVG